MRRPPAHRVPSETIDAMNTDTSTVEHLHQLLQKFDTAMLVTHTAQGEIRARPMAIVRVDPDCRVWFFSGKGSGKVGEIVEDCEVNIVCQDEFSLYLSISGRATLQRNREKIDELWEEGFQTWFPQGKDDPDLMLIAVEPTEGEYWDNEGFNKIKYLFERAKAFASGSRPAVEEIEQHAKVALAGAGVH